MAAPPPRPTTRWTCVNDFYTRTLCGLISCVLDLLIGTWTYPRCACGEYYGGQSSGIFDYLPECDCTGATTLEGRVGATGAADTLLEAAPKAARLCPTFGKALSTVGKVVGYVGFANSVLIFVQGKYRQDENQAAKALGDMFVFAIVSCAQTGLVFAEVGTMGAATIVVAPSMVGTALFGLYAPAINHAYLDCTVAARCPDCPP